MNKVDVILILIFGIVSISKCEGLLNVTSNNSRNKGLCIIEVPTIDLLSENQKGSGYVPPGNGSRPGYSKIISCCPGYQKIPHTFGHCEPICINECVNGNCTAPNVCVCHPGFVRDLDNNCVPTCPKSCLNGDCTLNGICSCRSGYVLHPTGKFCVPECLGGCGIGGICKGPNRCECQQGFQRNPSSGKCEYYCEGGCNGGACIGPNKCSCRQGYVQKGDSICEPQCPRGCKNGLCSSPNVCTCKLGWNLNPNGVQCDPICLEPCLNGVCVGPNKCECNRGYVLDVGFSWNRCTAHCEQGCVNGQCTRPNYCICNAGFVKQSRGSNVCIKRERRSVMHWDLIPEQY